MLTLGRLFIASYRHENDFVIPDRTRLDIKARIEQLFDLVNVRDLDALDKILEPSHVDHTPWGDVTGVPAFKQFMRTCWLGPFPDAYFQISDMVLGRELAAWRVRFTGTNTGGIPRDYLEAMPACPDALSRFSLMGVPPSGRRVDVFALHMSRFSGRGRQVEHWTGNDQLLILQQLSLLPAAQRSLTF
jgi:predicted ester cyclase